MIGANGNVRGKKEFEPSSQAAESEPLLGPHLEGVEGGMTKFGDGRGRGQRQTTVDANVS